MKRVVALMLVVLLGLPLLAGCDGDDGGGEPSDTFVFITMVGSDSLDPTGGANPDKPVMHAIYSSLLAFAPDGTIVPRLAESFVMSDDGMSVYIQLRENVRFHNGEILTADDVIYTFDVKFAEPRTQFLMQFIAGYEKIDDLTVRFDKVASFSQILNILAEFSQIVPREAHSSDPVAFNSAPIGAGPYRFVSQGIDGSVHLEAFDDYFGEAPGFRYVTVRGPLETAASIIALETGEADMIAMVPLAYASQVRANPDLTIVIEESWSKFTLLMMHPPLSTDMYLRRAIFHGINRESAIILGNDGIGEPATELFSTRIMGDYAGMVSFEGFNEELARYYVEKSDYTGEEIVLHMTGFAPLAESVAADLRRIGINFRIEMLDFGSWVTLLMGGEMQLMLAELGTNMISPIDMLVMFASSDPIYGVNMEHNEEFDNIMAEIMVTRDDAARRELLAQALELSVYLANIVPLFDVPMAFAFGPAVTYEYAISGPTYVFYLARVMPR